MKVLIIGASCSGKTTLARFLRAKTHLPILEIDEELVRINGGTYPLDHDLKHQTLAPRIIREVLEMSAIVFFSNTDYFTAEDIEEARRRGFKVIQLQLALDKLQVRNLSRVANDGYPDNSEWLPAMIEYQVTMKSKGLFDRTISTESPVEVVAAELLNFISPQR